MKHWRLSWFRYETFITFFKFRFSTWEERDTIFLCWLFVHHQLSTHWLNQCVCTHPAVQKLDWPCPGPKNQIALSNSKSQLTAFIQNHKESQPITSGHDIIHIPISSLGFLLWHLWLSHPPPVRLNTCVNVCTYHALSRKVLSLTKPKDKIYKMKNDNI